MGLYKNSVKPLASLAQALAHYLCNMHYLIAISYCTSCLFFIKLLQILQTATQNTDYLAQRDKVQWVQYNLPQHWSVCK